MTNRINQEAAAYAEVILSPEYREAQDAEFAQSPDTFIDKKNAAQEIIIQAVHQSMGRRALGRRFGWEGRRLAAIRELDGQGVGQFVDVFRSKVSERAPTPKATEELAPGEPLVVQTNNHIMKLDRMVAEPMDYFKGSLDWISQRRNRGSHWVGPENYATAFKLFADKTRDLDIKEFDQDDLLDCIDQCLAGFTELAVRDEPNVIEMTNVNVAVGAMPAGSVDKHFAKPIVKLNLERLRDYDQRAMRPVMFSLSKLDLSKTGEASGELVDLLLRQGYEIERSGDMRVVLRAIANLPKGASAEMAFATLVEKRNQVERALGVAEIEEVTASLRNIVDRIVDDPKLRDSAIDIADAGLSSALEQLLDLKQLSLPADEFEIFHEMVQRAVINRNEI